MGIYLNPGNEGFAQILNDDYVDKTGMIAFINSTIDKPSKKMTCFSRPRRFGKTMAAKMLCAYYDKSCDSRILFEGLEISKNPSFEQHLNKYNVIYLDITRFILYKDKTENIVEDIQKSVIKELKSAYPDCIGDDVTYLSDALYYVRESQKERFFFIIDEWDAVFRETKENSALHREYVNFLRGMFKGGPATDSTIAGAYMTGILPIKKYGTESALTDFKEYTMVEPLKLAQYIGFTKEEVCALCEQHHMDFDMMEQWYDGYVFQPQMHIYSPNSVMNAVQNEKIGNYWTKTETYESLKQYISMNMDGLKDSVVAMLGGQRVEINPLSFQNDMVSMSNKDDVLTMLVHLGYLAYDGVEREVYIPNQEVAESFQLAVRDSEWKEIGAALDKSKRLLRETIAGNADYVAAALQEFHEKATSIIKYNDENSLACALTIAYYTAQNDYMIIRELPTGKGFADLVFLPRKQSDRPAMIVELKYNKTADAVLQQIKEKRYAGVLKDYTGRILLVGINYDKDKGHECVIEEIT